jgi:hypothetical protein
MASPSKLCAALVSSRRLRMDGRPLSISPSDLYLRFGTAAALLVVDVRRQASLSAYDRLIIGPSIVMLMILIAGERSCALATRRWLTALMDADW